MNRNILDPILLQPKAVKSETFSIFRNHLNNCFPNTFLKCLPISIDEAKFSNVCLNVFTTGIILLAVKNFVAYYLRSLFNDFNASLNSLAVYSNAVSITGAIGDSNRTNNFIRSTNLANILVS